MTECHNEMPLNGAANGSFGHFQFFTHPRAGTVKLLPSSS